MLRAAGGGSIPGSDELTFVGRLSHHAIPPLRGALEYNLLLFEHPLRRDPESDRSQKGMSAICWKARRMMGHELGVVVEEL